MKYNNQNKQAYLKLCQQYNAEAKRITGKDRNSNISFVILSLQLHQAKSLVPKRWGQPCFIQRVGSL